MANFIQKKRCYSPFGPSVSLVHLNHFTCKYYENKCKQLSETTATWRVCSSSQSFQTYIRRLYILHKTQSAVLEHRACGPPSPPSTDSQEGRYD